MKYNNPFETIDARLTNIECLLLDMKHTDHDKKPKLVTVKGACEYIKEKSGWEPAVSTLYDHSSNGTIACIKRGRQLLFETDELDKWLVEGRKATSSERLSHAHTHVTRTRQLNQTT